MPEFSPQRWLIYALGGGLGHFHRAIAMGRAATLRGHYIKILTNILEETLFLQYFLDLFQYIH